MTNASVESVDTSGAGVKALVKKQDGSTILHYVCAGIRKFPWFNL